MKSVHIQSIFDPYLSFSPFSVPMWENTDRKNSEYRHFSRSFSLTTFIDVLQLHINIDVLKTDSMARKYLNLQRNTQALILNIAINFFEHLAAKESMAFRCTQAQYARSKQFLNHIFLKPNFISPKKFIYHINRCNGNQKFADLMKNVLRHIQFLTKFVRITKTFTNCFL